METTLRYLSRADVESVGVTMEEVIERVEAMFVEKAGGRVEMPPKPGIHPKPDAFIHAMPAYIKEFGAAGMKWVSGFPANPENGLPYISGLLVLNDVETGFPLAVMDCTWITAMRTAAATAVAAKHMARPDSRSVGILGAGVQGFSNLHALTTVLPVSEVSVYDVDPGRTEAYVSKTTAKWPHISVNSVDEPRGAVSGMDVVVTAGPILRKPHATIQAEWPDPGLFASLVDFDSYWQPEAMARASKFVTDDVPQLKHYREAGYFQAIPAVYGELSDLVSGSKPGRTDDEEITMACNLGLALEDMAVAPLVLERAVERGMGTEVPL